MRYLALCILRSHHMTSHRPAPLAVIFNFYDVDQSGFITKDELLLVSVPLHRFCFGTSSKAEQVNSPPFWKHPDKMVPDVLDGSTSIIFLNTMTRTRTTS